MVAISSFLTSDKRRIKKVFLNNHSVKVIIPSKNISIDEGIKEIRKIFQC